MKIKKITDVIINQQTPQLNRCRALDIPAGKIFCANSIVI